MKNLTAFLVFTISIFCSPLLAQGLQINSNILNNDKELNPHPHQIGLSLGFPLRDGLKLSYRKLFPGNQVLRIETAGARNILEIGNRPENQTAFFNLEVGYEKHFPLTKKLSFYVGGLIGVDFVDSGVTFKTYNIDALAGLKYNINNRLSIYTEARYGFHIQQESYNNFERTTTFFQPEVHVGILYTINKYKKKK